MKTLAVIFVSICLLMSYGCSPVKTPITTQYQLSSYCIKPYPHCSGSTILVSTPEAANACQTPQMFYIDKPFEVDSFANNAWVSPPATMLHALLIKSLQATNFFCAVTSSAYSETSDYRLDTQIFNLEQNFLKKPSVIQFSSKIVLTEVKNNRILASKVINEEIPCPSDTPLGGVIAANKAMQIFTAQVDDFVISRIRLN